jgi:hypothetical protein
MANFVPIKNFENLYAINENGEVMILKTKKIKKAHIGTWKYYTICLYKDKKSYKFLLHRLIAETFLQNKDNKEQVNHKDGNKLNNYLNNLEWTSRSENLLHAYKLNLCNTTTEKAHESRKQIIVNLENGIFYNGLKEFAQYNYLPKPYTIDNFNKTYKSKFKLV